jgi:hypothetical protein
VFNKSLILSVVRLLKITLSVCIALVMWEIILRQFIWRQPHFASFPKGVVATSGSISVRSQEGFSKRIHKNEFGTFHEINKELPILVMQGDSYTYAEQVSTEENYSTILRTYFYKRFEILNVGYFGMNVSHYVYNEKFFKKFNPIYHIIQVKYDDFFDSLNSNEPLHFKLIDQELDFELYQTDFAKWVADNMKIYNMLNQISILSYVRDKYLQDFNRWVKGINFNQIFSLQQNEVQLSSDEQKTSKLRPDEVIRLQLKKLKQVYGERFALLYLPRNPKIKDKKFVEFDGNEFNYHKIILKLCLEENIDLISMWQPFLNFYRENKILVSGFSNTIPGDGHLNSFGHILVADSIKEFIEKKKFD